MRGSCTVLVAASVLAACGGPIDVPPASEAKPLIVVSERGQNGGQLVFLLETGERYADLTSLGLSEVRDSSPAWSPDGRWVAFASTRGRSDERGRPSLETSSLWVVEATPGVEPHRVTTAESTDSYPRWTPGGDLVFASDRGRGQTSLWMVDLELGPNGYPVARAAPREIVAMDERALLSPTVSPDGSAIAFMATGKESTEIWVAPIDGSAPPRQLTEGPADLTPAWSPDGATIAFAAPAAGDDRGDAELYLMDADGSNRRVLVDHATADETGPVWSHDGRYVFATSLLRSVADGKPILASVAVVDLRENPPTIRGLFDWQSVKSRIGPAVAPEGLDATAVHRNMELTAGFKRAVEEHLIRTSDP